MNVYVAIPHTSTQTNAVVFQILNNEDAITGNDSGQEEEQSTNTSVKPLKVLIKRYSTKRYKRHHVEEARVHFRHEDTSSSDEDSGASC